MAEALVIFAFAQQIVVVLLLAHMLYFRPHRTSLWFLGATLPFAVMYDPTIYEFHRNPGMTIGVFDAWCPIVNLLGFLFVYYVSLSIATSFVRMLHERTARYSEFVNTSIIVFVLIGVCMEILNESLGWWALKDPDPNAFAYVGMWIWRPAISFPIFFAAMIEDVRIRRRMTALTLLLAVGWMASIQVVRAMGLPQVYEMICTAIIFLTPLSVWIGGRLGWIRGDIAIARLQYPGPQFVFRRTDPFRAEHA
ncbi:MAG: hypothetical protein IT350_07755 [Deltaproteobacteria bacterium]|nr:hypothetical protein [Deltaproteobacteria bacterium]